MEELICNLHMHSIYSDGTGDYTLIGHEALKACVDVAIITDHNVHVKGMERYIESNGRRALLLTGEEVHDQDRMPQKNHLLVIGCEREVAEFAHDPQRLVNQVNRSGGLTFLAHPYEHDLPMFNETDITWDAWEVEGFTGIELWNGLSEFKTVVNNMRQALTYAFFPQRIPHQPLPQALIKWDELLAQNRRVVAVAGSDSHALSYKAGFIHKVIFPYSYHFSTINNHLLVPAPLSGSLSADKAMLYHALSHGASFIGYDLPVSTRGFTFTIENSEKVAYMGDELTLDPGATLRVKLPQRTNLRVIHNGKPVLVIDHVDQLVKTIDQPGVYRVEAYIEYLGKQRGWIFSNPIYVRDERYLHS
jgi:hypothetical protein